ncbi:RNA polymerase sigma factor [Brevibacillus panacihumi]|uniref:RNA polymerase sigma factor n=1 Tax=Brevibacillus panacihumi TaxID=497735 RepID=UPI003D23FF91
MEEDQQWVSLALNGNTQAYAQLIAKYKNKVYAIVYRMVHQTQDAQDITQECFIKAYQYLYSYDSSRKFSSWLYRIAINHCLKVKERNKHKQADPYAHLEDVSLPNPVHPETIYLKKESANELRHLINQLPDMYKMILLLRYIHELSYQEMSDLLDIPLNTVQVRLHRAKQKLRELYQQAEKGGAYREVSRH